MIDHKMLHNATFMIIEVVDASHFNVELWCCVTCTTVVNCFEKYGFNENATDTGKDAAELDIN